MRRTAIAIACILTGVQPARPCAPAPHLNEPVYVREESALVVWHPETRTEDFIREASFFGRSVDFGFLVPTPSEPELSSVSEQLMNELSDVTAPKTLVVHSRSYDFTPIVMLALGRTRAAAPIIATAAPRLEVLRREHVSGYEAAVLRATDAGAVERWLRDHQYDVSPDLQAWLEPYVRAGWIITAFKVTGDDTSLVRMTFHTDRPFFPYREPASQRSANAPQRPPARVLRIWFAGPSRVAGTIGEKQQWPGTLTWSDTLDETNRRAIEQASGIGLGSSTRLSAFIDQSSPRPGVDDLYFAASSAQQAVLPPPDTERVTDTVPVPADAVGAAVLVAVLGVRRMRRISKEK